MQLASGFVDNNMTRSPFFPPFDNELSCIEGTLVSTLSIVQGVIASNSWVSCVVRCYAETVVRQCVFWVDM